MLKHLIKNQGKSQRSQPNCKIISKMIIMRIYEQSKKIDINYQIQVYSSQKYLKIKCQLKNTAINNYIINMKNIDMVLELCNVGKPISQFQLKSSLTVLANNIKQLKTTIECKSDQKLSQSIKQYVDKQLMIMRDVLSNQMDKIMYFDQKYYKICDQFQHKVKVMEEQINQQLIRCNLYIESIGQELRILTSNQQKDIPKKYLQISSKMKRDYQIDKKKNQQTWVDLQRFNINQILYNCNKLITLSQNVNIFGKHPLGKKFSYTVKIDESSWNLFLGVAISDCINKKNQIQMNNCIGCNGSGYVWIKNQWKKCNSLDLNVNDQITVTIDLIKGQIQWRNNRMKNILLENCEPLQNCIWVPYISLPSINSRIVILDLLLL